MILISDWLSRSVPAPAACSCPQSFRCAVSAARSSVRVLVVVEGLRDR